MISRLFAKIENALGLGRWSPKELAAAAVVSVVLLVPITSRVSYSGAWDGDPSVHNLFVRDAVNIIVAEHAKGGDPLRGFLQCYHIYPKMLHEILLTAFIITFNGMRHVEFGDVERFGAWFATLWTLAGFVVLYNFLRLFFTRLQSLAVMPIVGLSGYILMYANFPRQNMPSHVLSWLAMLLYVRCRLKRGSTIASGALISGIVFGAAVAVHYSATYLFAAFVAIEGALLLFRRDLSRAVGSLVLCFAGATLVWFFIDLFYYFYVIKYPNETNFDDVLLREHHSFLEGMVASTSNLSRKIAAFKLVGRQWWFLPGFYYRSFGPIASLLAVLGILSAPFLWRRKNGARIAVSRELLAMIGAVFLASILVSLEYFQNARKLMPFFPVCCVFLGFGFNCLSSLIDALRRRVSSWSKPEPGAGQAPLALSSFAFSPSIVFLVLAAHFLSFGPALFHVYQCRRDAGYMRAFLAEHGIDRILVAPINVDSRMARDQVDIRTLTLSGADTYEYMVVHRLYKKDYSEALMAQMRNAVPIVSFQNQAATPLFWYEFPVTKKFMDYDDPLTNERSLYRWKDVRAFFAKYCEPEPVK